MLPTKFQVNWHFSSGEEAKKRFLRWPPWQPSWISGWNDLAIFDLQVTPMLPSKFQVNWPFDSGEKVKKYIFKMAAIAAILDFNPEQL